MGRANHGTRGPARPSGTGLLDNAYPALKALGCIGQRPPGLSRGDAQAHGKHASRESARPLKGARLLFPCLPRASALG